MKNNEMNVKLNTYKKKKEKMWKSKKLKIKILKMKNKLIQNKQILHKIILVLVILIASLPLVFALPVPTGVAAEVTGTGATNANVIVIAFEEGTNYELDTIITTTDSLGRFAGALTTDLSDRMDVYVTVISDDPVNQLEVTIEGLNAGDDRLLYLEMPEVEDGSGQEGDGSDDTSGGGSGGSGGGGSSKPKDDINLPETEQKPSEEMIDSFPPIEDEYQSEFNEIIDLIESDGISDEGISDLDQRRVFEPEKQFPDPKRNPLRNLIKILPENTVPIIISLMIITILVILIWLITKRDRDEEEKRKKKIPKKSK